MEIKEQMLKLIDLEAEYRLRATGKSEMSMEERYEVDKKIFPKWWYEYDNYITKINILNEAIEENKNIYDVEKTRVINNKRVMKKIMNID